MQFVARQRPIVGLTRKGNIKEVKYRVWCKNRKEWEKDSVVIQRNGVMYNPFGGQAYNLENHIIQMFTGLKDKHGKEVYEGDIVTISRYHPDEVLYQVTVEDIRRIPQEFYGSNFNWSEIDGNIFENPPTYHRLDLTGILPCSELGHIPVPQPQTAPNKTHNAIDENNINIIESSTASC